MQPADNHNVTEAGVIEVLKGIFDPEIPVNIYDLGLIYEIRVDPEIPSVYIKMTLTSPGCPVAASFPGQIEMRVRDELGVDDVEVELTFDPPFTLDRLSEEARLQLGLL